MTAPAESAPQQIRWPQPGEVWSLWDMLRAYAHEFCVVDRTLRYAIDMMPPTDLHNEEFERTNGMSWRAWANDEIARISPLFDSLPVGPSVTKQLRRTLEVLGAPTDFHTALGALTNLLSRFRDELEDIQFLHVTPRLAEGLGETPPFGEPVDQAFPSASLEIRDAARCLAVGQGTATVFHCMRSLEPCLIALGSKFGVAVKDSWNSALNDIEKAIRDRPSKRDWPNWKDVEPFYMEACTHFFIIKNAWRNHTMHLNLRFSEQDALSVYDHTKAFMQHLATTLSEDVEGASPEQSSQ